MASLKKGEWSCYGGHFNGRKNGHVTEDGWMNGVLGHFYALSRLNWAGDNLG